MNAINDVFDRIEEAERRGEWNKCIELCREVLSSTTDSSKSEEWFKVRFKLANFLLEDKSNHSENIEEAIELLHNLLTNISQERESERWAYIHLCLGFAYDQRIKGDKQNNLQKLLEHYDLALTVFEKGKYPNEWAMIKAGIGLTYAQKKNGDNKHNIIKGIENYLDTLIIYTKEEYPEDYEDSIRELSRLRKRLDDETTWQTLMEEFEEKDD